MSRFIRRQSPFLLALLALLALLVSMVPGVSLACTCAGTAPMWGALLRSDKVVVGRVEKLITADYSKSPAVPEGVVFGVLKTLKGDVTDKVYVPTMASCYQSFSPTDFKVGEEYVLPLLPATAPIPEDPGRVSVPTMATTATEPAGHWFNLPDCSHSALALVEGDLYTNELTDSGGRTLHRYMSLNTMEVLFPLGLLDPRRIVMYALVAVAVAVFLRRRYRKRRNGA